MLCNVAYTLGEDARMSVKRVHGPISAQMLIDQLQEQVERTEDAKDAYHREVAARDAMIRDLKGIKLPLQTIARITRLSRESIKRIVYSGHNSRVPQA